MSDDAKRKLYQLKIWLPGAKPPIWRRIRIQSDCTLSDLRETIVAVMGWCGMHTWQFGHFGRKMNNKSKLNEVFRNIKDEILFIYDFADNWDHIVKLESIIKQPKGFLQYPICVAGRQACPPEDCGGMDAFKNMLKVLKTPSHADYEETWDWLRDKKMDYRFQPGYQFDPKSVLNPW